MIGLILYFAASCTSADPAAADLLTQWCRAVEEVERRAPKPEAGLRAKMLHLIRLDEVTRQHLWLMDEPSLDPDQRRIVSEAIGQSLLRIDGRNTAELKKLLPPSGWFSNRLHGKQITHGAWLIAQHSPDDEFREYALKKMADRVKSEEIDARDYALTFDRVQVRKGFLQRYGSQARCSGGRRVLAPLENEDAVNDERDRIGWAQTIEETKGDLEIGKPCTW